MPRTTSVAAPVAHLVGPGKIKIVNGRLAFSTGHGAPLRLDPRALRSVFCYGPVGVTDEALRVLFDHDVQVAWLTSTGTRCRGRLARPQAPAALLRMQQHAVYADPSAKLEFARDLVLRKIETQSGAARYYRRRGQAEAGELRRHLDRLHAQAAAAQSLDEARGVEGAASAAWFGLFGRLLAPPWEFHRRVRRPPTDPVNALLSLGYTFLISRVAARLEAAGLEVQLGALHEHRPGRPSLACDVMEPLRVPAVDRWVVQLCNQGLVRPVDFLTAADGGVRLEKKSLSWGACQLGRVLV